MELLLQASASRPGRGLPTLVENPPDEVLAELCILFGERPDRGGHDFLHREVPQGRRGDQGVHFRARNVDLVLVHGAHLTLGHSAGWPPTAPGAYA
jgi:hypothetical protein